MKQNNKAAARDRNILGGIVTGLGGRAFGLLAPFLVMPAMLKHLGEANFGTWMTAVSITSMAMFMDFGIGNGLLTKLSKAYGNDDWAGMRSLIATGYAALSMISLIAAVLLLVGLVWVADFGQEYVAQMTDTVAIQIAVVTSIAFLIGIPVSVIQRVMLSCQQTAQSNAWQIAGSFVAVAACYGVIYSDHSSSAAVAAYAMSPILVMLVATVFFFVRNPRLIPRRTDLTLSHAKELIALGSYFFILSIITSIALNSDNVIIALTLGAESVTTYAIPAKLASILGLLVTTLFLPLWAANGDAIARKDYVWIERTARRMSLIGGLLVCSLGLMFALFNQKLVEMWMGRVFEESTKIVAGYALMYTLFAVASPYNMILNAAGLVKIQILAWAVYFLLTMGLKVFFLSEFHRMDALPFISAFFYLLIVLPVVCFSARKYVIFN